MGRYINKFYLLFIGAVNQSVKHFSIQQLQKKKKKNPLSTDEAQENPLDRSVNFEPL
jgi:hypothetical protein